MQRTHVVTHTLSHTNTYTHTRVHTHLQAPQPRLPYPPLPSRPSPPSRQQPWRARMGAGGGKEGLQCSVAQPQPPRLHGALHS